MEEWIGYARPDVLCLQETKLADTAFPAFAFRSLGYESVHHGSGRWNGVAILSRMPITDVVYGFCEGVDADQDARLVSATCGGVRISSVYVPNGRALGSDHYAYKLSWLDRLCRHLDATCDVDAPLAVCGDFNVAPEDRDVWDPARFVGSTHLSAEERAALGRLLDWGLHDVFRIRHQEDRLFTYWDYRAGDFHNHRGMRIDLVLVTAPLAGKVSYALIDRFARKGKLPSDHAPLLVDFED